jgi:hypothetical protein
MGRMQVGRFSNRADALDYLVARYSTKRVEAKYILRDGDVATVIFSFEQEFDKGKRGVVQYSGNGGDLSAAIADLFSRLDLDVNAEPANAE